MRGNHNGCAARGAAGCAVPGRAVPGRSVPGRSVPGRAVPARPCAADTVPWGTAAEPADNVRGMSSQPAVSVERSGPVYTVVLSRPAARNAVDGPTAAALVAAFR
ncbi:MAG: enoyl-CoA hydratase, partial [Pseudonocardiales bacterium]|nr:enoyl-CoA hydratase [Pseudonocardiales bacterium]